MILDLSNILVNLRSTGQSLRPQANTLELGNNVSDPCDGVAVQHVLLVELTPHIRHHHSFCTSAILSLRASDAALTNLTRKSLNVSSPTRVRGPYGQV